MERRRREMALGGAPVSLREHGYERASTAILLQATYRPSVGGGGRTSGAEAGFCCALHCFSNACSC